MAKFKEEITGEEQGALVVNLPDPQVSSFKKMADKFTACPDRLQKPTVGGIVGVVLAFILLGIFELFIKNFSNDTTNTIQENLTLKNILFFLSTFFGLGFVVGTANDCYAQNKAKEFSGKHLAFTSTKKVETQTFFPHSNPSSINDDSDEEFDLEAGDTASTQSSQHSTAVSIVSAASIASIN